MRSVTASIVAALAASITALSGCSGGKDAESGQVVASVNGTELTAAELDTRIAKLPAGTDKADPEVLKRTLRAFVDEVLLAQAAEKDKLDKKPTVVRDIAYARNVVLANAYVTKNVAVTPISQAAIRNYYNTNGAMFANRRKYDLTDLSVPLDAQGAGAVVAAMRSPTATIEAVTAAAAGAGVRTETDSGEQFSDALPAPLANGLAERGVGDLVTYELAGTQHLTRVDQATDAPLSFDEASRRIEATLGVEQREAGVNAKLSQLRGAAKIDYGDIGRKILAGTVRPAGKAPAR